MAEPESAPLGSAVEIVIVLGGEIDGQFVVNGIFSEPLQRGLRRVLHCGICGAKCFDMHHKRTVSRKIDSLFRHNYLSVEARVEVNHRDELTFLRLCQSHDASAGTSSRRFSGAVRLRVVSATDPNRRVFPGRPFRVSHAGLLVERAVASQATRCGAGGRENRSAHDARI
jgi:hypothetical protein